MPYYAQREGLPDTHSLWADPGSSLEAVYLQLGHVKVHAPQPVPPAVVDPPDEPDQQDGEQPDEQ